MSENRRHSDLEVWHVIGSLDVGGAERFLVELTNGLKTEKITQKVVALKQGGRLTPILRKNSIEVIEVGFQVRSIWKLLLQLRRNRNIIIQTWLYHSDLFASLLIRCFADNPILWGVHNGTVARERFNWKTWYTMKTCARISGWLPTKIVCCATKSSELHIGLGYHREKFVVINNGIDCDKFSGRASHNLPKGEGECWIGMGARLDPVKRYDLFFRVASKVVKIAPSARFIAFGRGVEERAPQIAQWKAEYRLQNQVLCLGEVDDVPATLGALDIYLSTSDVEAFPLGIGEAMAMGLPCVGTDVGDTGELMGETGYLVKSNDADHIVRALVSMIDSGARKRKEVGDRARSRVSNCFSLEKAVANYAALYQSICSLKAYESIQKSAGER